MIDVWAGVEQSAIDDDTDQWRRHLHVCIPAIGIHVLNIPCDTSYSKRSCFICK